LTARYLADTSAWNRSAHVQGRWEDMTDRGELALCPPVLLELLYSARGPSDYASLVWGYSGMPTLPLDDRAIARAVDVQAGLAVLSQHRGPKPIDLFVAAIAELNDTVLLHHDHHFDQIRRVTGQAMEWLPRRGSLD
jgi:predicted nucleic acid-binding protein